MTTHTLRHILESISVVGLGSVMRIAVAATAVAVVSVTILAPPNFDSAMSVVPSSLDMTGQQIGSLEITNRSSQWRSMQLNLASPPDDATSQPCRIRYSPASTAIPPGGTQIVRIVRSAKSDQVCQLDQRLILTDPQNPAATSIEIPLTSIN